MRRLTAGFVVGLLAHVVPAFGQGFLGEATARATTPEIPYDAVSFLKMPPGIYMGEGVGVAQNSKGHLFVLTRSNKTQLFEFDQGGNFVKEWGKDSYAYLFAHAVRIDSEDNVWTVDEGTNIVTKYSPQGKLLLVLGKRPDPLDQVGRMPGNASYIGSNRPYSFHRPTDVAFDAEGNIFVGDGYTDSRIVKYDRSGRFLKAVGTRGNGVNQFSTPHGIAADAQGNVYVADRTNRRIVVLDNDLNWKATYDNVGAPWGLCISLGEHQYLYSTNSTGPSVDERLNAAIGEIYKMELDGTVIGRFGRGGTAVGQLASTHTLDCRDPNVVYAAEIQAWRVQRLTLQPEQAESTSARRE